MNRILMFLLCTLFLLPSFTCAEDNANKAIHQNSTAPEPLAPLFKNSDSLVLARMARFLDDYPNNFSSHKACKSGKASVKYGYSNCDESFANGIYTTTHLLTEDVAHNTEYAAVFYLYSGTDAVTERDRLVAIVEEQLPIGKTDGSWDLKFQGDKMFSGYHYYWADTEVLKIWVRYVDEELQVSATAYLTRQD